MTSGVSFAGYGGSWVLPSGAYTVEFRFKRTAGHFGVTQIIMGRWASGNSGQRFQWLVYFDTSDKLSFIHATNVNGTGVTVQSSAISDTGAHAARIVYDGTSLYLYIDGTRVAGPTAVGTLDTIADWEAFQVGDYGDRDTGSLNPLWATIGDLRLSNSARSTGASYTVSGSPLTSDANTLALVPMSSLAGAYLDAPSLVGTVLARTGYSQASGGWANPCGPFPQISGGWFFSVSAYNGTDWTVYAVTASTLSALLAGSGTVGASAIQTPTAGENHLAANGTVIAWGGTYHHYYTDASSPVNVRHSTGSSLGSAFSPQPGTVIFSGYADVAVRPHPDGTKLVMFMTGDGATQRVVYISTSTDGSTWTTPSVLVNNMAVNGYTYHSGEYSQTANWSYAAFGFGDGASASSGVGRRVIRWNSPDGTNYLPGGQFLAPSGSDSGSNAYLGVYDPSPFYDAESGYLYLLAAHSTNTQPSQPTDSDIALWRTTVNGL